MKIQPWQRGPVAWEVSQNAEEILKRLNRHERLFFSLRQTAQVFGVSTQPVRDWITHGFLKRDGPRGRISEGELQKILHWFGSKAKPFDSKSKVNRFYKKKQRAMIFGKLRSSEFEWPKEETALSPKEISRRIGCHPSLVRKAIHSREVKGYLHSPYRWKIRRKEWMFTFLGSILPSQKKV